MTKYEPLQYHLDKLNSESISMTFKEIEELIGDKLPLSARKHRAWWSNNPTNSVITHAWLQAGYKTEKVDLKKEKLVFRKIEDSPARAALADGGGDEPSSAARHPVFGCMKGLLTIAPGYDLTAPLDEEWGDVYLGSEDERP